MRVCPAFALRVRHHLCCAVRQNAVLGSCISLYFKYVDALSSAFQFSDAVEFCESMADLGKIVIVAALDGTYQRQVLYGRNQCGRYVCVVIYCSA